MIHASELSHLTFWNTSYWFYLYDVVLECPSESYIDSVVNDKRLKELQTAVEGNEPVVIVIHMTPQVVFEHPKYQEWINEWVIRR